MHRETESKTWASGKERKCSQRDAHRQRGRSELRGEASGVSNFRNVSGEGIKKALGIIADKKPSSKTEFLQVKVKLGHGILYLLRIAASVLLDLLSRDIYWCDYQHLMRGQAS